MDERWIKIVHTLYHENKVMSIDELAVTMGCTYNTIKSTLAKNSNTCVDHGFRIIESNVVRLEIIDANKFLFFLSYSNANDDRVNEIIVHLLSTSEYVRIEDLADMMFVSRATIDRFIPEVKMIARSFKLELVSRPKFGITIQGSEINKRLCLAQYQKTNSINTFSDEITNWVVVKVQSIISESIESNNLQMNDINFYNLVQHSIIMITRIRRGNGILEIPKMTFEQDITKELNAGEQICNGFEKNFRITINEAERMYIVMHLLGKRIFSNDETIRSDVLECINEIFDEIDRIKGIDLHQDVELMTALALHIQPLISRMEFGLIQQNPLMQKIKSEMSDGFEYALCASEVIHRLYSFKMNEDEVAYLALHFTLALERRNKNTPKKKIAVVCSTGKGTAKLIQYRLMGYFKYREEDIILTSLLHLDELDYDEIDCILTTIPLEQKYPVQVISIDLMLSDDSLKKVDNYFSSLGHINVEEETIKKELIFANCNFTNREEILKFMCKKIKEFHHIDLFEQVMKREELSSTEVGNHMAYPHPYQYNGDKIIVSAMSLEKPIKWKFGDVQLILLLCYPVDNKNADVLNKMFTKLVMEAEEIKELIHNLSAENLIRLLRGD